MALVRHEKGCHYALFIDWFFIVAHAHKILSDLNPLVKEGADRVSIP